MKGRSVFSVVVSLTVLGIASVSVLAQGQDPLISQQTPTGRDGKQTIQSLPDGKYLYGRVIDPKQPDRRVMFRKIGNKITAITYNFGKEEFFQGTANRNTITNTRFPNASRDGKLSFVDESNISGENSYRLRLEEAPDNIKRSLEEYIKVFSNNQTFIAQNKAPQRFIDIWTDNIFSSLHPELSGRKIQFSETEYIREWQAIQAVVANDLTPKMGCTGDSGWGLSEFDGVDVRTGKRLLTSAVLNKVADAIFYTRHPELGRKIKPGEYKLKNEWMKIRQAIWTMPWC